MPKTILLADDSVTIQKVVGISFANEDVVLLTVDNGDDAVIRARELRPDLVLADIAMPGKDGYAVCEAIKGDPELAHVPVLLLSGTFETFDDERARQVRADGHITKPFEAQALVDRVNDLLARAEAERPVSGAATTVLVSEQQPSASDAFEFFDDELASASQSAVASSAATVLLDAADEVDEIPLEPVAGDALDIPSADDLDAPEVLPAAHFEDERQPGDGHATMLFDAVPPPIPSERSPLDVEFGETRSSRTPLVAEPEQGFGATRLMESEPAADPLDFGFESEEVPAIASTLRDTATIEPRYDADDDDSEADLFEAEPELAPPPIPVTRPEPSPAAAPASGSTAHLDVLRTELREHLEKVAWEAFGDLSERIVRETVARVEAVAWEVIPQMAETLIREEIRKLQSDE